MKQRQCQERKSAISARYFDRRCLIFVKSVSPIQTEYPGDSSVIGSFNRTSGGLVIQWVPPHRRVCRSNARPASTPQGAIGAAATAAPPLRDSSPAARSEEHTSELQSRGH